VIQLGAQVQEGSILGRYELLLRTAQGGMACVWAARLHGTRGFRKLVAVKTILPGVMGEERLEEMFLEEASLASGIHHPNVVDTIELGEHDGTLFMVLEWVDGEPLSLIINEAQKLGGIPLPIGVNLVAQACKGLHAAHELSDPNGAPLGLVHRDISPHNLLVTFSGIVKVVDFGIAKATQKASTLTEAGEIKGKLAYMAPEQVRGREVDRRADVFALGTLLYVITTGRHPWKGDNPGETAQRLCSERPAKPPSANRPDYPEALEAVVLKALEKNPDKRYASAAEMLAALDDAVPTSLEGNAEARVAEFMKALVGPRGVERRKQIRLAGELLDLRRDPNQTTITSGTSGSTSAVALDTSAISRAMGQPSVGPNVSQPVAAVVKERRRLDRFVWLGVAAVTGCLGIVARGALDHKDDGAPRAAASLAPHASELLPPPPAPAPSAVAAPAAAAATTADAAAESDDEREDDKDTKSSKRRKLRGTAAYGVTANRAAVAPAAPAPSGTPAATPTLAAPAAEKAPAPRTSADAWNPQTFGNRY
jgi:eukaryotic-like serine/threonine-protein kinase